MGRWQLLYDSPHDGIKLPTLYRTIPGHVPTLLVVHKAGINGHVFGAFPQSR